MKSRQKIDVLILATLILVLSLTLLNATRVAPTMYFGYPLSNSFQTLGDFYDPVKGHTGIDIATPLGTSLSMTVPLRVVDIRQQNEMGTCLYTQDAWGNILVFAHLSEILVAQGDIVKSDQVFAKTGNTGTATKGPHLHFEIIAEAPEPTYEIMSRTLGNYSGFNINPAEYWNLLP